MVLILCLIFFIGCADRGTESPTGSMQPISFSQEIQPIFTANCAFSGCHAGSRPRMGMNLEAGNAYSNIVNVPSQEAPSVMRIRPSNPDSSYLYLKLEGEQSEVGGSGEQMPQGGILSDQQITLIEKWIDEGAKDN